MTMKYISADANGPARWTITGRWVLSTIDDRRWELIALTMPAVVTWCCQQQTDSCRLCLSRLATPGVPWPNFLSLEFISKFQKEMPVIFEDAVMSLKHIV